MTGKVKTVNSQGYGFISTKDNVDFFFHHSNFDGNWRALLQKFVLSSSSKVPIEVEFDVDEKSEQGPKALNVKLKE